MHTRVNAAHTCKHASCTVTYEHSRVPTLTVWCNREPSWKLTLPTRQPAQPLSDRPTDVIQRHGVLPQPCKTIRLRSHCWGSHYLALSIGETIFGTRTNTRPFLLFPPGSLHPVAFCASESDAGKWPGDPAIFRMACPEATIPFSFPRKS